MDNDFDTSGRIIINFPDFYFTLFIGLQNRVNQRSSGLPEWYFIDYQRFLFKFGNLGTYPYGSAPQTVIVSGNINQSSCRKIRIQFKTLSLKMGNRSINELIKIMRENFRSQSHSNSLHSLCQ